MKRFIQAMMVASLGLFLAGSALAYDPPMYTPGAGINGTVHDLATAHNGMNYTPVTVPADTLQRICIYCHAPHNTYRLSQNIGGPAGGSGPQAPDAFDYLPLWNHDLTGNYASYTMYQNGPGAPQSGSKASQAIQNTMTPGSSSLLCLSCHDGSVAVNKYGNTDQPAASYLLTMTGPSRSTSTETPTSRPLPGATGARRSARGTSSARTTTSAITTRSGLPTTPCRRPTPRSGTRTRPRWAAPVSSGITSTVPSGTWSAERATRSTTRATRARAFSGGVTRPAGSA
jgi:hypothetical protein